MHWATVFVFILMSPGLLFAANADPIVITQGVTGDVTSPTVPAPVTASAVSSEQIDVTWGAATDDTGIGGYVVYRDGAAIATTTLLTFSDSGLIASTTYTYYIVAFDNSSLYSSSSATTSATTEAAPIIPIEPIVSDVGGLLFPTLRSITVSTTEQTARLEWDTNIAARYFLRWGRTDSYEMGGVQNEVYRRSHETLLENLQPGTKYYFELIAINRRGDERLLEKGTFSTFVPPDVTAPPNVALLSAVPNGNRVELSWILPSADDLEKVRIVRNHLFIPTDPNNGFVIYEGLGQSFIDESALATHNRQYYTAYSYDVTGNVSSGAVVVAERSEVTSSGAGQTTGAAGEDDRVPFVPTVPTPDLFPDEVASEAGIAQLKFDDFWFWQSDVFLPVSDNTVSVSADTSFVVGIGTAYVPERFRSLTVRFEGDDRSNAFLFALDASGEEYEAAIETLAPGTYDTTFTITALTGRNVVVATGTVAVFTEEGFIENAPFDILLMIRNLVVAFVLILVLFLLLWWRRRARD